MRFKFSFLTKIISLFGIFLFAIALANAQSGASRKGNLPEGAAILNVIAKREKDAKEPIKLEDLALYENSIEQKIKSFSLDPSPSRILLLVDNSQTIPVELEKLQEATKEFAYEIFEGDQLFIIGYDEKAEIIQEWTDDAKKVETSLATFRKKGNPYLFDALDAGMDQVLRPLMPGTRKTVIVLIGDGLDRGSIKPFDKVLNQLQNENITVYALQIPDRTNGAYRRDRMKPNQVIEQLTEGTGGKAYDIDDASKAAKEICDELRKSRYILSYQPTNFSSYDARRVFVTGREGITIRTKNAQPPNVK